ncbi:hypothetical protein L1887_32102 [Cichorium endivia]|nr:hypothetical protein L1887_32102 [Cichorium endivia]
MLYSLAHFVSGGSASSLPQISEKKDNTRVRLQVPPETKEKKRNLKKKNNGETSLQPTGRPKSLGCTISKPTIIIGGN